MGNEIFYSGLGDLRTAAVLSQELLLLAADRGNLWNAPGIVYFGEMANRSSTVLQVPIGGLDGYNRMAAVAENASTSNTAFTDASATITIARQALQYQISDLATLTDTLGLNPQRLAASMVGSAQMRLTEMIAGITDDFSATVGTTTVDMDSDDWFDAIFTLEQASVSGPYMALLYPTQWTDLQTSIRSEVGPWSFVPATQDALTIKGPGYVGSLNGVEIFKSSLVPTANAGADSAGGMWGYGAIGWADASAPTPSAGASGVVYPAGTRIFVEFERDAAGALTKVVGNYYAGVSILQNGLGVSLITDR